MVDIAQDSDKVFKWGDVTTSPKDVPLQSLFALAQRGYSHVLGNEVAAQVAAYKKSEEGAKASETEIEAYAKEKRDEKLAKILDGTLGVRTAAGPRVSGIEAIMRSIAVEFLKARFKKYSDKTGTKVAVPTGENTVTVAGKTMTREDLIAAELRANDKAIREEATRRQEVQSEGADVGDELFSE
jgi:hypothetical protein